MPEIKYRIRTNPRYDNICSSRIGSYRELACYDCPKLAECDSHFSEETGEWDYEKTIVPKKAL